MRIVPLALCLLAAASTAQAQERPLSRADLPRNVEARLNAIIENPATLKITGEAAITEAHEGDVVVFNGPLTLATRINGQLVMVDGNVQFQPNAAVAGDVTIVNGEASGLEQATIDGTVTIYEAGFRLFGRRDKVLSVDPRTGRVYRDHERRDWGRGTFMLRSNWNYNRVEGLPVEFGPLIETGGRNPTRVEALAIWRTEVSGPLETDDWGYALRAEQFFGGRRDYRIGASLKSVVRPIEEWQLTRSEASLATFVMHRDYRDYYEREGWSAYVRYTPRASGVSALLEYSDEEHATQPARDPWTLLSGDDAWRLQPLVAEGRFRSVRGSLQLDRRNDDDFPSAGFLVRTDVTRGLSGSLAVPAAFDPLVDPSGPVLPTRFDEQFTRGLLDARMYGSVGRAGTVALRLVGGGALGDQPLPPQFQHALGGAGSLPGYGLFSADCGARRSRIMRGEADANFYYPYYGCDRMVQFSAEYRGGFSLRFGGFNWHDEDDDDDWGWNVDASPRWIVFFDAARGWAHADARERGAVNTGALYDVGAGILLGGFGFYAALPLTGEERDPRFFIRLGPRF